MRRTWTLPLGDAVALLLFAVIGLASHHKSIGLHGLARDALPVLAGWFVAAAIVRTYRRGGAAAFLLTWALGVTGGVLVRGLLLHRHVLGATYLTFVGVTLGVTLVLLGAWRGLFALAIRRTAAPASEKIAAQATASGRPDGKG